MWGWVILASFEGLIKYRNGGQHFHKMACLLHDLVERRLHFRSLCIGLHGNLIVYDPY